MPQQSNEAGHAMILNEADDETGPLNLIETGGPGLWVFGYGSLMWRPDFEYVSRCNGRLIGLHRSFCIWSIHHRGTIRRPGLVLGLDGGGACDGVLYYVAPSKAYKTLDYLRRREQVTRVYREVYRTVELADGSGREVRALCYVAERYHPQFVGRLSLQQKAEIIKACAGQSGTNIDYLLSTIDHLEDLGVKDAELHRLLSLTGCAFKLAGCANRTLRC